MIEIHNRLKVPSTNMAVITPFQRRKKTNKDTSKLFDMSSIAVEMKVTDVAGSTFCRNL